MSEDHNRLEDSRVLGPHTFFFFTRSARELVFFGLTGELVFSGLTKYNPVDRMSKLTEWKTWIYWRLAERETWSGMGQGRGELPVGISAHGRTVASFYDQTDYLTARGRAEQSRQPKHRNG